MVCSIMLYMYVRFPSTGIDRFPYLFRSANFSLGSLGCARSAQHNIRSSIASARSAYLNLFVEFIGECSRRVNQRNHKLEREASRLLNTLEERLCRERHKETSFLRILLISARRASSECKECIRRTMFQVQIKEKCQGRHFVELLDTLSAQQGVLEHKFPRGNFYLFEG
jgi:hypothetical protein